jgi:hypothetical protein
VKCGWINMLYLALKSDSYMTNEEFMLQNKVHFNLNSHRLHIYNLNKGSFGSVSMCSLCFKMNVWFMLWTTLKIKLLGVKKLNLQFDVSIIVDNWYIDAEHWY